MIALLTASGLLKWAAGAIAAVLGVLGYGWAQRHSGASTARAKDKLKSIEADKAALERMNNAQVGDDDPRVLAEWLRERGKQ